MISSARKKPNNKQRDYIYKTLTNLIGFRNGLVIHK